MHSPPFNYVAYLTFPSLPPLPALTRDSRPQPEPVKRLGRALGMTTDGDGNVWIFVEPAEADLCTHKVNIIHCRKAVAGEALKAARIRAESEAAAVVTP